MNYCSKSGDNLCSAINIFMHSQPQIVCSKILFACSQIHSLNVPRGCVSLPLTDLHMACQGMTYACGSKRVKATPGAGHEGVDKVKKNLLKTNFNLSGGSVIESFIKTKKKTCLLMRHNYTELFIE